MSYTICSRFKGEHIVYAGYTICTSREHIVYGAFCGSTKHVCVKSGHYRSVSETPSEWRFADGPIVATDGMLARWAKMGYFTAKTSTHIFKFFYC